jgi:tetratricopeptide (TPR) repeat protein
MARRKRQIAINRTERRRPRSGSRQGDRQERSAGRRRLEAGVPRFAARDWLLSAALVAAVFLAYQPVWYAGYIWDDDLHLVDNPVLKPGGWLATWVPGSYVNYWPVTFTAYRLQYAVWGLNAAGFHLVNLAVHAGAALLVWRVLVRLRVPGAIFAAALFALHPVNVESAAWIAQLKNTLSLLLTLLSMLWYLSYEQQGGRWRYLLSLAIFLLATLSKGMTLTLPIVLLACAWWQRNRITRRDLLRVVPFLLIGMLMTAVEIWLQQQSAQVMGVVVRSDRLLSRAAVAGCAVWFYFGKLVWPVNLLFVYPRWQIDPRNLLSYVPGLLLVLLLALAWRRRHTWGRPVVMLLVCYVGLLGPTLGFVNVYFMRFSLVADHWQYAAMIVPCAVFAGAAAALSSRRRWSRLLAPVLGLGLLAALAALTFYQSRIYANVETLYRAVIAGNPDCWLAHGNLGEFLAGQGRTEEAIACYQKALEIYPDCVESRNNLGFAYARLGRFDEAIPEYRAALMLKPHESGKIHNNLGAALVARRRFDEAIAEFGAALETEPDRAEAHINLGDALASQGRLDEAVAHFQRAVQIQPELAAARQRLDLAISQRDRLFETLADWRASLRAYPDDVPYLNNIAWRLATDPNASIRNGREAVELAQRAVRLSGGRQPAVLSTLAAAYAEAGRFSEAVETAKKVIELAAQQNNRELAESNRARISLYRARTPFRQRS